jgi:hypothetical protein
MTIYNANYKKSLTVKELKALLENIPKEYDDAACVITQGCLERNIPLEINKIKLTNACDVLEYPYDESSDEEVSRLEKKKVFYISCDKFWYEPK